MKDILAFFKDIFTLSDDDVKVGLSQFKVSKEPVRSEEKKPAPRVNEVKLSDLMRKSY